MSTNITQEHRAHFKAVTSGRFDNLALVSCFVDGRPTSAIAAVEAKGDIVTIAPLFVAVTEDMSLTDHEGAEAA